MFPLFSISQRRIETSTELFLRPIRPTDHRPGTVKWAAPHASDFSVMLLNFRDLSAEKCFPLALIIETILNYFACWFQTLLFKYLQNPQGGSPLLLLYCMFAHFCYKWWQSGLYISVLCFQLLNRVLEKLDVS